MTLWRQAQDITFTEGGMHMVPVWGRPGRLGEWWGTMGSETARPSLKILTFRLLKTHAGYKTICDSAHIACPWIHLPLYGELLTIWSPGEGGKLGLTGQIHLPGLQINVTGTQLYPLVYIVSMLLWHHTQRQSLKYLLLGPDSLPTPIVEQRSVRNLMGTINWVTLVI